MRMGPEHRGGGGGEEEWEEAIRTHRLPVGGEADLKVHGDGGSGCLLCLAGICGGEELHVCRQLTLPLALHVAQPPHDRVFSRLVLGLPSQRDDLDSAGVGRDGNTHLHLLRRQSCFEQ